MLLKRSSTETILQEETVRQSRKGFLRMLELQDLGIKQIEDATYFKNPPLKASMIFFLLGGYGAITFLSYWYDFVL